MGTNPIVFGPIADHARFLPKMKFVADWLNEQTDYDLAVAYLCSGGEHRSEACRLTTKLALNRCGACVDTLVLSKRTCVVSKQCQGCYDSEYHEVIRAAVDKMCDFLQPLEGESEEVYHSTMVRRYSEPEGASGSTMRRASSADGRAISDSA